MCVDSKAPVEGRKATMEKSREWLLDCCWRVSTGAGVMTELQLDRAAELTYRSCGADVRITGSAGTITMVELKQAVRYGTVGDATVAGDLVVDRFLPSLRKLSRS